MAASGEAVRYKIIKFLKNFVFQAYGLENIKLVACERRSSIIVPEMVLFLLYFFHFIFEKNDSSFRANKF